MSDEKQTEVQQPEQANPEDQLQERLRALDGADAKKPDNKRSPALLLGGLLMIGGLGLVGYMVTQPRGSDRSTLQTGLADDFQTIQGSAYGEMPAPRMAEAAPAAPAEPVADPEAQRRFDEMQRQLEALQAELAARDAASSTDDTPAEDDPRIAALAAEIEALRQSDAQRTADAERALRDRELEIQRLQAALDLQQVGGGPVSTGDPLLDERARAAEEARRRAQEQLERRTTSSMIAFGGGSGTGPGGDGQAAQNEARLSDNEAFVRNAGQPSPVERASIIVNPSNTVTQGTMIQAILETAINSQLPGAIRAVVSEDVHAYDASRVLIPRGSIVIGKYSEDVAVGQRRALVAWERIIMPDNQSVNIAAYGADQIGQSGLTGRVNTHFGTRFGSAALISFLSILPALATDNTDDDRAEEVADRIGQNLSTATSSALGEYLTIRPTIHVDQGTRVTIMVDRDLEIF